MKGIVRDLGEMKIFEDILVVMTKFNMCIETIQDWMECYNMIGEPKENDPIDVNIPELESTCTVEGFDFSSDQFLNPLKVKKINFSFPKNPKFANIGDYWDDETIRNIMDLLHAFRDTFLTKFL